MLGRWCHSPFGKAITSGFLAIVATGLSIHLLVRDGIHLSDESITHLIAAVIVIPSWLCFLLLGQDSLFRQIKQNRSNCTKVSNKSNFRNKVG